jgi:hypothetical protein
MPPYFGVPRLSHQLPVEVVLTAVVTVDVVVVDDGATVAVLDVVVITAAVVVVWVDALVVVVVDEPQDASTIDATRTKLSTIQIAPLFI